MTESMKKIHVNVSKPYDVLIGRGIFYQIPNLILSASAVKSKRVAIITDDIVAKLYLEKLKEEFAKAGFTALAFVIPNGEQSKNIQVLSEILEFLAENKIRRNDEIIALGGGVVGDIAGFSASIYMRGIPVIQIPTTLLAAVDSSVGGKTAIDLRNGKNLVGSFWQPSLVICDVDIIDRLPDTIFSEGMAEVIKCNVIRAMPFMEWIRNDKIKSNLDDVIYQCVLLKRDVVERDEFDIKGIRNILNVGHTVAHAIEKLSNYKVSHGHAVATGMIIEAQIAQQLGKCTFDVVEKIRAAVGQYNLVVDIPWTAEQLAEAMKSDKKNRDDAIVFELPSELGKCSEYKLSCAQVVDMLETSKYRFE